MVSQMSAHSVRTCLQRPRRSAGCFFITLLLIAGCGPTVVSGGTAGRLKTDNNPLSDVQITVFPASGGDAIGRAVTDATGTFSLVNHDSTGALQLPSGSYVFVLESVGAPISGSRCESSADRLDRRRPARTQRPRNQPAVSRRVLTERQPA
jgi:hypothetical protein